MKTSKLFFLSLGIILLALTINVAQAQMPSGYMEYFVPGSEEQMRDIFVDLQSASTVGNYMHTVITLVAAGDSIDVYYDHWEDGYDLDPNNLAATADEHFFFANAGDVLSLESSDIPANPRDSTQIYYDGQDHFLVVGGLIATSRASWPEKTGTVLALALEFFSIHAQDTNYIIPVGENLVTALGYNDFISTYVIAMAVEDGTSIEIDDPKTPGVEVSVILDKGEVTQLFHIDSHTSITANKRVQVNFAAGDPAATYEMRGYVALPSTFWSNNYYNPVPGFGTDGATDLYIFNPNAFDITVSYEDLNGSGNFVVSAGATKSYEDGAGRTVPVNSGVNLASADTFWAMGSADTESSTYDWGFTLLPKSWLTSDTYIGWAPGTSEPTPTSNGSPLFVTPINDTTTIYVDYSPTDGVVDVTYTLDRLEVLKIFDPDNDNTGMHVYGTDDFAIMWGEDPNTASGGNPYLDMGYTVLPLVKEFIDIVLTLDKTANPDELPQAGGNVRFTLQILSYDYSVDSVDVTDLLPTDWAYVADSTIITLPDGSQITGPAANPSITGQELFWDISVNMTPNDTLIIDFMAQPISPVDTGYHDNYAYAQGTRFGDQYFTPHDHVYVYVTPLPDIVVTKTDSVTTASPGDTLTYTITIQNDGSRGATGIDLKDTLDANVSFVSASDGGTHSLGVVSWPAFGLTGGNSTTRTVTVSVDNPLPPGVTQIFNVAVAYDDGNNGQDPNLNNNRGTDTDNVSGAPDIVVTKTDSVTTASPGDNLTYTITISNNGNRGATGIDLKDTLDANVNFVSASDGGTHAAGVVSWPAFSLDAGSSVTRTVTVSVNNPLPAGVAQIFNVAVAYDDGNNGQDPNLNNNRCTDTDNVSGAPDIVVTKTDSVTTASPGDNLTYTITISNEGNRGATGIDLKDTLDANVNFVSASNGGTHSLGVVSWPAFSLDAGSSVTRTVTVSVDNPLPAGVTQIFNVAVAYDDGNNGQDPNLNNNRGTDTDNVGGAPDIVVTKTDSVTTASPGDNLTYTITISNNGNRGATGIDLKDTLDANVNFVSASDGGTHSLGVVSWPAFSLDAGSSVTRTVTVSVDNPLPPGVTQIFNVAIAYDDGNNGQDPNLNNNRGTDTDNVSGAPDIVVTKTDSVTTASPGDNLTYTITISNEGSRGATGIDLKDTLDANVNFVSASDGGTHSLGVVSWPAFSLDAGSSVTRTVTVSVNNPLPPGVTQIFNVAVAYDDGNNGQDPNLNNNRGTDTDNVSGAPDIVVTKTDSVSTASPDDTLTYTITIQNNGSRGATGIDLKDTLDANVNFVSASDGGTHSLGVVSWPAFSLDAGSSVTRTVTVSVNNPLPAGVTQIFNVAVAYDDGNNGQDPNLNNNRGTDTDNVIANPLIEATKTDTDINGGDLEPGDTLLYTVVISNTGNMDQGDNAGNEFEDSIPVNTNYVTGSVSASGGTATYNGTENRIEWNGGVAAGDSVTVTFKVALDSPLACGTVISNQGTVNWDSDGNNTNDSQEPTDDPDTPQANDATQSSIIAEPLADFSGTPTSGCAPLTVNFTDLSTNNPTNWKWYFGDGDSSSAQNPQHTYNSADTFTVTLITTNACGSDTMIKSDYIKVTTKPMADFSGNPTSGCAPLQVSFTDLSTNNPTSWKWYFGDGDSSALQNPQHTYTSVDTFTVTLIATNGCGSDTMTKTAYIKITGTKPVADFSASPTSGCVPLTVNFTDLSTNNPTSWKWYFGDGDSCTLQNPQHIYTSVDTFTVTLIATNHCGSDTTINYIKTYACAPFIEATKTDTDVNGGYLEPGDTLLYTVVISNTGNLDQGDNTGNEFEDSIPTNTNYATGSVSASSDTATYNGTENRIEWNGSIAAGDSVIITFKVVLHSPLPNGTIICNQGTVNWDCDGDDTNECYEPTDDPDTPEDDDPTKSTVVSAPFIEATKTDTDVNGGYLEPGDTLLYTVVVSNTGNMNQGNNTGNEFEDQIPVNTTFDNSYTPTATSGTVTYNAGMDKIEWNGSIAAGSSITITFRVALDFPLANGTVISNQGTVNWDCDGDDANECYEPTDDPDTPEDDDPTLSIVTALPLIEASKYDQLSADVDSNGMASPADLILYTITISNSGKAPATNVTFSDTPDSNTTLVVGSVITTQGTIISGNNSGDDSVVVNIGTIPIGFSVYITFQITINDPFPIGVTQIANQGYISSNELPDEPTDDPHTPVDDDPTKTPVTAIPIIEIYKTDSLFGDILGDGVFGPGDTILYEVSIFNNGNTAATGVTFTDTPDTNTALVVGSVTTSQGVIVSGNNTGDDSVLVNIDTISSQGSVTIRFLASINDPLPAGIERLANQGYVNSNELPPEFTDDSDTPLEDDSTLTAIGVPDIALSDNSHDYGGVPAGDCSSWTLVVCNVGTAALKVYSIESDNPLFVVESPSFPQIIAPSGCIDVVLKFCPTIGDCCFKVANITITSNDPDEEILTVTLQGHGICPSISGKVTYYSNGAPIKDVTMTLSGGESRTITTYNTGFYVFQDLSSGLDYTVTPSKHSSESDPAISAYDAGLLLQHITGEDSLSAYQQMAGDVSGNEGLSSYDASLILQYSAYLIDHFPANDWTFVPESRSYTSLISDYHNQDYLGILTGDVSGNWSSSKKAILFTPNVSVWVPETTCVPGDTVIVPIYVSNVTGLGIISANITLTFDSNTVSALNTSLGDIVSPDWLIESNVKPRQITIAMAGAIPLGGTGKLVKIPLIIGANAGMDITIHIERCQFNEGGIPTDLQDGKISIVTGIEEYSDNTIPVSYELSQNVPNPFTQGITTISYSLPVKSNVILKIYDVTGQLIRTLVNEHQEPGHYAVSWGSKDENGKIVAPGVYFYCLKAGAFMHTKKMVLLR